MHNWWPKRVWSAGVAVGAAVLTGVVAGVPAESGDPVTLALVSGAIAALALFAPAAITAWVVWGLVMAGSVAVGDGGDAGLLGVAVMVGVVGTAEPLAAVARMNVPIEPARGGGVRRTMMTALITVTVGSAVLILGGIGGLGGLAGWAGVAVGAGACAIVAVALVTAGSQVQR